MRENEEGPPEHSEPPALMTRSRTRAMSRQILQSDDDGALKPQDSHNSTTIIPPPPPHFSPPQVFVQYLEEPRRKVVINEGKSVIFELTQAIEENSIIKVARLVEEKKVDINHSLSFGISILLKAVRNRSAKVVDYLIENGADVESSVCDMMKRSDALDESYNFPHQYDHWCIQTLMKMLPKLGSRLCQITDREGRTLLHLSCFFPDATLFNYLLEHGCDPNALDNYGSSALALLISHRDWTVSFKMIQSLLALPNVDVDICDINIGSTPLFQSFLIKRLDIFFLLLSHGADPFISTHAGSTLMHLPFLDRKRLMILYDLGLSVNAENQARKRPLQDRQRFDMVFFIMILLGRIVTDYEFEQMQDAVEPIIVSNVKSMMLRGEFSSLRLQSMCRQTIRKHLFKRNHELVTENIYNLPIPNPLKLYLDVCSYAESMLITLGHKQQ